jgi:HYR domain
MEETMKPFLACLAAAAFLVLAGVASADTPVTVGSGWFFLVAHGPGVPSTPAAPFTFATPTPVLMTVTDLFCLGDTYTVSDGSMTLGTTSPSGGIPGCPPDEAVTADAALSDPRYSHGRFALGAGNHAVGLVWIGQFGSGSGVSFRLDPLTPSDCENGGWQAITATPAFASEADCVAFATVDTTPPVIAHHDDVVTDATGPGGATVAYTVTATDDIDPAPVVSCTPPSASQFAIGTTTVSCTATDAAGNSSTATFAVTVEGAAAQLTNLGAEVIGVGPGRSLAATVSVAKFFLAHGATRATCLTLSVLELEVRAQAGKKIPVAQAAALIADARRIRAVLGC